MFIRAFQSHVTQLSIASLFPIFTPKVLCSYTDVPYFLSASVAPDILWEHADPKSSLLTFNHVGWQSFAKFRSASYMMVADEKKRNKKFSYRRDSARCGNDHSRSPNVICCCANRRGI